MTIKEIDAEIQRLQNLRYELKQGEIASFKEQAKKNINRCFTIDGRFVKVIGVPEEKWSLNGCPSFNQYQYPALYLGYDIDGDRVIPFYYDTVFSGIWGDGNNLMDWKEVREITEEEFNAKFDRLLEKFRGKYIVRNR